MSYFQIYLFLWRKEIIWDIFKRSIVIRFVLITISNINNSDPDYIPTDPNLKITSVKQLDPHNHIQFFLLLAHNHANSFLISFISFTKSPPPNDNNVTSKRRDGNIHFSRHPNICQATPLLPYSPCTLKWNITGLKLHCPFFLSN